MAWPSPLKFFNSAYYDCFDCNLLRKILSLAQRTVKRKFNCPHCQSKSITCRKIAIFVLDNLTTTRSSSLINSAELSFAQFTPCNWELTLTSNYRTGPLFGKNRIVPRMCDPVWPWPNEMSPALSSEPKLLVQLTSHYFIATRAPHRLGPDCFGCVC